MEAIMSDLPDQIDTSKYPIPPRKKKGRPKKQHNAPAFDLRTHCYRILGVDLTAIDGMDEVTAHMVVTEVGPDFSAFRSGSAFCSWLRLCPNNEISGGRILSRKTRKGKHRLALALRTAASTLHSSQTPMGDYFRRMRAKFGPAKAITAAAHKMARIIFHMVTTKQAYDATILEKQDAQQRQKREAKIRRQAGELGFQLTPLKAA